MEDSGVFSVQNKVYNLRKLIRQSVIMMIVNMNINAVQNKVYNLRKLIRQSVIMMIVNMNINVSVMIVFPQ